ncbi:hypothetical protein QZH41_010449 [Actinostola sp. cb2023]|nr:hypothetical protein QZH41_010449 [Actinostola sp. cb2023]
MATAREVISLQFGHYSNFVGTHLWNIQESIFSYDSSDAKKTEVNHDCLFRVGRTLDGQETYTPRLLSFDLKGSLRNFSIEGALYSSTSKAVEWEGELSVHQTNLEPKNEFQMDIDDDEMFGYDSSTALFNAAASETSCQSLSDDVSARSKWYNLDDYISVWSDFAGTQYHPKSVNIIKEYSHDADHFAFDMFGYGQSLYANKDFQDEFENNLHFFLEECDQLQGFQYKKTLKISLFLLQVLTDLHNGFAGLSAQVIEDLADEYSTKSIVTFGFLPATFPESTYIKAAHRLLNMALSYNLLSEHSSIFTPLSLAREGWFNTRRPTLFPYLTYKADLAYHTSAVLASTIDTLTIPYRLDTVLKCRMDGLANTLTFGGRKITSASCSFPLPVAHQQTPSLSSKLNSRL